MASLKPEGSSMIQKALDELTTNLPGCYLTLASPTEVLYDGASGVFDVLDKSEGARKATTDDIMWFASTTKLLTAVCYLTLVDKGILSLETKMTDLYPPLKKAASKILKGFKDGEPIFEDNDKPITLAMMLNQTSGFGMEFGETVQAWKKYTKVGAGFVNSCKVENLIHTPICYEPGTMYEYGNSAEWLALILPTIVDQSTESYLQENLCKPLGMNSTTYYPFGGSFEGRLMPLRFGVVPEDGGKIAFEVFENQLDLLKLPRTREEIEYPAGGGGIYSKTSDYILLLQNILSHYNHLTHQAPPPPTKILSDKSLLSLFSGTLPESAKSGLLAMYNPYLALGDDDKLKEGECDWSTAFAIYQPKDGRRREGWGREVGSVGWGGAAGTEYWIDKKTGIACVFTTQMLPGNGPVIKNAKKLIEKAVYEALA